MSFSSEPSNEQNLDGEYDILDSGGTVVATAVDGSWAQIIVDALNDTEPPYGIQKAVAT